MPRRNPKRNRDEGHAWEVEVAKQLRNAGYPFAVTARSANRARDAEGIDIVNKDEFNNGRMLDDVQCKCTTSIPWQLLLDLDERDKFAPVKRRKVLALKLGQMFDTTTGKRKKKTRAVLGIVLWRDYLEMLSVVKRCEQLVKLYGPDHPMWKMPIMEDLLKQVKLRDNHG